MNDERLQSDAALLQGILEGRIDPGDARVRELLERRPEWRELGGARPPEDHAVDSRDWQAEASEEDRRLVAECLAHARSRAPAEARPPAPRRKPRSLALLGLAAAVVLFLLARAWLGGERSPATREGGLLGAPGQLDCVQPGETTPDFDSFAWTWKGELEPKGVFVLTIRAEGDDGTPGRKLLETETRRRELEIPAEERAAWPERILWSVEVRDSNGVAGAACERHSRRSPH